MWSLQQHRAALFEFPFFSRGANPYEVNTNGDIPLHVAAELGREKNVEVLLKYAESKSVVQLHAKLGTESRGPCMARPKKHFLRQLDYLLQL